MIPGINGFEVSQAIRDGDAWRYLPEAIVPSGNLSKNEAQWLREPFREIFQKGAYSRADLIVPLRQTLAARWSSQESLP